MPKRVVARRVATQRVVPLLAMQRCQRAFWHEPGGNQPYAPHAVVAAPCHSPAMSRRCA